MSEYIKNHDRYLDPPEYPEPERCQDCDEVLEQKGWTDKYGCPNPDCEEYDHYFDRECDECGAAITRAQYKQGQGLCFDCIKNIN